ncbi:MAG: beta-hydroxyacyl-ACP dehydratase [Desulfotalea sp.]
MTDLEQIKSLIPHREPFLLVDKIVNWDAATKVINTEKTFPASLDVFKGHYPEKPIVPGVLLSESIFQSAALLMGLIDQSHKEENQKSLVPVLTRIGSAKFKRFAGPDTTVQIQVIIIEEISSATVFKGKMKIDGKLALQIEFTCAMVSADK